MKKLGRKYLRLLPLLFLALGIGLSWLLRFASLPNPVLYLRADLANLILISGVLLTAAAYVALWVINRFELQQQHLTSQAAADRLRFMRRLDHELKNPLTAIRAGVANASEAPDDATRQEAFNSVAGQAQRLGRLAVDLRKLAELETRPLERVVVDIAVVLQEAFDLIQEHTLDRHLSLAIPHAPWPLPHISGDPDLLFLAIYNLMENAVKFTLPDDRVEVRAFEDGHQLIIEIADTGPGIPEDELPHVWEDLYRGQGARGVPGSGLGLALVRAVVERHHGQVNLRSRVDQGSLFTVRLPVD